MARKSVSSSLKYADARLIAKFIVAEPLWPLIKAILKLKLAPKRYL